MPDFKIEINAQQEAAVRAALAGIANGFGRAASAAINKTVEKGRSDIARDIRDYTGLKLATVRGRVLVRPKANPGKLSATIRVSDKHIRAIDLRPQPSRPSPRPSGAGVSFQTAAGPRVTLTHSFVQDIGRHRGVFLREGAARLVTKGHYFSREDKDGRPLPKLKRQPIVEVYEPGLGEQLEARPGYAPQKVRDLEAELAKQLASQISRLTAGQQPQE